MNESNMIPIDLLSIADMERHPVWKFSNDDHHDTSVYPLNEYPVINTGGVLFTTQIRFANEKLFWAIIGNVHSENVLATEQFLALSIVHNDKKLPLARYFDPTFARLGPESFAKLLNYSVDDVFPISYDISKYVIAPEEITKGKILKEPKQRLSKDELMKMVLRKR